MGPRGVDRVPPLRGSPYQHLICKESLIVSYKHLWFYLFHRLKYYAYDDDEEEEGGINIYLDDLGVSSARFYNHTNTDDDYFAVTFLNEGMNNLYFFLLFFVCFNRLIFALSNVDDGRIVGTDLFNLMVWVQL